MNEDIKLKADKINKRKKRIKIIKLLLLILALMLLIIFFVVSVIYNNGNFTISLDKNLYFDRGIIIYDNPDYKVFRTELYAEGVEMFDNISYRWLPNNLHDHNGGSHNGDNYIAYTFYIENRGEHLTDYWTEIVVEDVIKNVDEAVRIRVYKDNEEEVTYAKMSKRGTPEPNTIPFLSDSSVFLQNVKNFRPGDIHKYTIVIWLEGSDPECTNNILGGEIKLHMDFKSEFIEEGQEE